MTDVVKVYDLAGRPKFLGCQATQLTFDFKLDTIGAHFILSAWFDSSISDSNTVVLTVSANCVHWFEGHGTVEDVWCRKWPWIESVVHISVVRYHRYLDKYRKYPRFDTSIEEVSIYRDATILPSIVTIPVSILRSLQFNRSVFDSYCILRDSNKKSTSH